MFMILLSTLVFVVPSLIAHKRKAKHFGAIYLTNLIFFWSFIGWTIALIWAVLDQQRDYKWCRI